MINNKIKKFQEQKEKGSTAIESPNLYEMNKQIIEQTEKPMPEDKIYDALDYIVSPFFKKNIEKRIKDEGADSCYFMLLCREDNNYTVFNVRNYLDFNIPIKTACEELTICLNNRGTVYSIENTEDNCAIEIWIKDNDKGMLCYYLFPYNEGVIEV